MTGGPTGIQAPRPCHAPGIRLPAVAQVPTGPERGVATTADPAAFRAEVAHAMRPWKRLVPEKGIVP